MPEAGRFIAYVAESSEWEDDGPYGLGTFSGHVEDRTDPDAPWPSIQGVSLDAAVRWARERADRVVVRLAGWDQEYTAGTVELDLPPLPDGLNPARRRSAGWEFLDRTADDEEIDWHVDVAVDTFSLAVGPRCQLTPFWPAIRAALERDPRVLELPGVDMTLPITESNGAWSADVHTHVATLAVRGRTVAEATASACGVVEEVAAETGWEARGGGAPTFAGLGAYPSGSRAARANAGFGRNGRSW